MTIGSAKLMKRKPNPLKSLRMSILTHKDAYFPVSEADWDRENGKENK